MDHNLAIENHTAERYLMGELNEPERDAYEEHFFSCAICAEQVRTASEFMETAKEVAHEEMTAHVYTRATLKAIWEGMLNWRSILQPAPIAACLLFLALIGYQNGVTIPRLARMASPQLMTTFLLHAARDGVNELAVPNGETLGLQVEIPPAKEPYTSYVASVISQSDITKFSLTIPAERAKEAVEIKIPSGSLEPGTYTLLIEGVSGNSKGDVERITFKLKLKD